MFILWYIPFMLTIIKNCFNSYHGFWLVWTTCELSGNTITHIMKIKMWCFIIVLHWYCGVHTWIFNESHIHIGHIIFWNILWNVNHKALSKLDDVSARSLGLVDAIPLQLQLISTIIKLKLVFLVEAAFSCLQIPIISKTCLCEVCWFKIAKLTYKDGN